MAKLSRGIQVIKWRNDDNSRTTRYRIRIRRKGFEIDKVFDTLEEAEKFLPETRSEAGRKQISEKEAQLTKLAEETLRDMAEPVRTR